MDFRQIPFVFGCDIITRERSSISKIFLLVRENVDRFFIRYADEAVVRERFEFVFESFLDETVEKRHFFRQTLIYIGNDVFDHLFRDIHVLVKIGESHQARSSRTRRRICWVLGFQLGMSDRTCRHSESSRQRMTRFELSVTVRLVRLPKKSLACRRFVFIRRCVDEREGVDTENIYIRLASRRWRVMIGVWTCMNRSSERTRG